MHNKLLPSILAAIAALLTLSSSPGKTRVQTVWLSSLDLSRATQGYGKARANRSVDGHPLMLNGTVYTHGFGTHSPGLLLIRLQGGTSRFTATVGIDDEVGNGSGSADFQVLGDNHKLLWHSGIMRQGMAPKVADVNLSGVQEMILRVTTGGDGYNFDHADWADAQFTVTGTAPQTEVWKPTSANPVIAEGRVSAPHINPPGIVGLWPNTPVLWRVPVTGVRPIVFRVTGLPRGLTVQHETGIISGSVATAGNYSVTVRAANSAGSDTKTVHIIVGPTEALTPPMGWNSYDCFGDNVTEAEILSNARYVSANLQPFGWDTVVVDYRWYDPGAHNNNANARAGAALSMDAYGRLLPAPNRFPSAADGYGFRTVAREIHALGIKFGIHIMRGIPRNAVTANLPVEGSAFKAADAANTNDKCGWCADMYGVRGDTPAGQAYYDSLMRLYTSWGVDYIKMDDTSSPYHTAEIEAVHSAILKCGRFILYSLSPGETPIADAAHVTAHANMWRALGDLWDDWGALNHEFEVGVRWRPFIGPGHWPDPDMLPLGHLSINHRSVGRDRQSNFTKPEQMTLMSLWSLLPAPLMVGANLPDNDPWTLALLTNPEVLAVNQDSGAAAGKPVVAKDGVQVWVKDLSDGSKAVGLFNTDDFAAELSVIGSDLGIPGNFKARDLWQRKDIAVSMRMIKGQVSAHGVLLLKLWAGAK